MKRTALICLVLGTVLVMAPVARAGGMAPDAGGASIPFRSVAPGQELTDWWWQPFGNAWLRQQTRLWPSHNVFAVLDSRYGVAGVTLRVFDPSELLPSSLGYDVGALSVDSAGAGNAGATTQPPVADDGSFAWGRLLIDGTGLAVTALLAFGAVAVARRRRVLSI